ncbi:hypothetical protein ACWGIU_09325 [Streptomyces sp. NPDC054840]
MRSVPEGAGAGAGRGERAETPIDLVDPQYATPAVQAVAGPAFQGYADGISDEKPSTVFGELADRLFGAALAASD